MAVRIADLLAGSLDALRWEPLTPRLRAWLDGVQIADTRAGRVVWEPGRVVPQYAVPAADLTAELAAAADDAGPRHGPGPLPIGPGGAAVLTPSTGFGVHSTPGRVLTLRADDDRVRPGAAFVPDDPDLAGHVLLDFDALDWREEDEPVVGHPRDPHHRIDIRHSSRQVRVTLGGHLLASSDHPVLLTETSLPVRWYLPAADVDGRHLRPSHTVTTCAYKGVARYWSAELPDRTVADVAWSYPDPLPGAEPVRDLVCFFSERVDVSVDGADPDHPHSEWT
jgi:uncharacterized protein (DUF427 family)